jgi:hypothetical protein
MAWTALIGAAMRVGFHRRIARLSDLGYWSRHTASLQQRQLRKLLHIAKDTEFGRQHGFRRILNEPDETIESAYRAQVPIRDYEGFRGWMNRMRDLGEPDVTWPDTVFDFAQTSGTTSGDKYMPVSKQLLAHNRMASFDIFCHAARRGISLPGLFGGKLLFLGGSSDLEVNEAGVRTGDLSGVVTPLITWPLTEVYQPGKSVALMSHWPSKIDAMARSCIDQDVRAVFGMASWGLVLFEKVIELARERGEDASSLSSVWPNLRLFVHGGVKYDPFEPRVREAWSGEAGEDVPNRLEVYPASEAFVAMQDTPGDPGLRLCVDHGVYFEFVPIDEIASDRPRGFNAAEVEPGQRYVVVLSTPGGLWRYILGDVVVFETVPTGDRQGGPARLRIVGRHKHFINAFGENIIVENIERAVVAAMNAADAAPGEFTAGPVYPDASRGRKPGLELVIEWNDDPSLLEPFARSFDRALQEESVDYGVKRTDDLGMGPPVVTPVEMGAFHKWMESRGKLGGQHKCPRCANHRDYIEGVVGRGKAKIAEPKA